ncbi:MAG: hypothetical protein FGF53_01280 [Candidatus Brockarchaeota archaeon]|nr:hypothetical protein [Candidatus Brockarchaeota archaeon]MBO3809341.1 hypothetical protein [Candidatus Brockarchaeota archaeon]
MSWRILLFYSIHVGFILIGIMTVGLEAFLSGSESATHICNGKEKNLLKP